MLDKILKTILEELSFFFFCLINSTFQEFHFIFNSNFAKPKSTPCFCRKFYVSFTAFQKGDPYQFSLYKSGNSKHCDLQQGYEEYQVIPSPGFPDGQMIKNLPAMQETRVQSLGWENPLEKEMATHSTTFAWKIPRTEEPGGLQSMGSQRVRHN